MQPTPFHRDSTTTAPRRAVQPKRTVGCLRRRLASASRHVNRDIDWIFQVMEFDLALGKVDGLADEIAINEAKAKIKRYIAQKLDMVDGPAVMGDR